MDALSTILLKSAGAPAKLPPGAVDALAAQFDAAVARTYEALDGSETYVYLDLGKPQASPAAFAAALKAAVAGLAGTGVQAVALQRVLERTGASAGQAAPFHYVVEITATEGHVEDISQWYDQEHIPGLATVPGCVHVQRFFSCGGERLSVACYEIADAGIRETAAWNANRGTAWGKRVQPYFANLKRNMYRALPATRYPR